MAGDRISLRMVPGFALVGGNGQERRASEAQSPVARGEGAVGVKHPPLLRAPLLSDLLQGWPLSSRGPPVHLSPCRSGWRLRKSKTADKAQSGASGRRRERKLGQSPDVMGFRDRDICGFLRAWKFHWH